MIPHAGTAPNATFLIDLEVDRIRGRSLSLPQGLAEADKAALLRDPAQTVGWGRRTLGGNPFLRCPSQPLDLPSMT
jgi:hypothetical protein